MLSEDEELESRLTSQMSSSSAEHEFMDLLGEEEDSDHSQSQLNVPLRKNTIHPFDYKYKVDCTFPEYCPRFVNAPTVIVLVGLPARGKTYMAKKLGRYLNWIGIQAKVFNVGEYRRRAVGMDKLHDFFRVDNKEAQVIRRQCALECLKDVSIWLNNGGQAAIFDATNTTRERRRIVLDFCMCRQYKVFFMESVCTSSEIVSNNVMEVKVFSPDYKEVEKETAYEDFIERIKHYQEAYEPLTLEHDRDLSFIKIINAGEQYLVNLIDGYLQSKAVYFLMNLHVRKRSIFLVRGSNFPHDAIRQNSTDSSVFEMTDLWRPKPFSINCNVDVPLTCPAFTFQQCSGIQHAECEFNVKQRIGGDSELTPRGEEFAAALATFINEQEIPDLKVWTSQLKRAVDTAKYVKHVIVEQWKALDEMDYGIYDSMAKTELESMDPEELIARKKNMFVYRYPMGESYSDVCARLEPVIMELERQNDVLVVCHEAVLQILMAYFTNHTPDEIPFMYIPFHTVFKLTPIAYGCRVEKFPFPLETQSSSFPDK